jgi:hypothetical protein
MQLCNYKNRAATNPKQAMATDRLAIEAAPVNLGIAVALVLATVGAAVEGAAPFGTPAGTPVGTPVGARYAGPLVVP